MATVLKLQEQVMDADQSNEHIIKVVSSRILRLRHSQMFRDSEQFRPSMPQT